MDLVINYNRRKNSQKQKYDGKKSGMKKSSLLPVVMLGISFAGFGVFYLFPFLFSFLYSLMDNPIRKQFVGMQNYIELFGNAFFIRGLKNTAIFMAVSIPLNMALSLGAAMLVNRRRSGSSRLLALIFLIPLVIPSAVTAFFWRNIFMRLGILNKFLCLFGAEGTDWIQGKHGLLIMVLIFLWKNIGYNMALYISGLNNIPVEYYECAAMEGAKRFWQFRRITLVYLTPTAFLVLIMSFVNSFKVFREIYIMTGQYPPDGLYLLQHYMNNMFLELNYAKLVSAVYVLTVVIVAFVGCIFRLEKKASENLRIS